MFLLLAWSLIPWKTLLIPILRIVITGPRALIPDPGSFHIFDPWSHIPRYDPDKRKAVTQGVYQYFESFSLQYAYMF